MLIVDGRTTIANKVTDTPTTVVTIGKTPERCLSVERPPISEGSGGSAAPQTGRKNCYCQSGPVHPDTWSRPGLTWLPPWSGPCERPLQRYRRPPCLD